MVEPIPVVIVVVVDGGEKGFDVSSECGVVPAGPVEVACTRLGTQVDDLTEEGADLLGALG